MLDDVDLDFDQSQTTSTKQKYMNCTNDIKSVNVTTTAKTIDHDSRYGWPCIVKGVFNGLCSLLHSMSWSVPQSISSLLFEQHVYSLDERLLRSSV